jgi:Asp-tRNA(Asn)/Glu-tRNA(Gln) amidotransferase A subunit family amidase
LRLKMGASPFNIVEATIEEHRAALASGQVTSVELVISYLLRIATYDRRGGLNAFTVFNDDVLKEAAVSDARRAAGHPPRPLEGIPYTLKDSYKYEGLTVTNGSPALEGLKSMADSAIGAKLRAAGAVLIGKTNMPPMAAGGMQRGLYGRAESPYNSKYLTAAFSSGSSNGAATSTAASMAVFGMGSETVSSGRSPASNNALIAYTPSRGVLSCRGLWPLYVTCDVPVPYARSVDDMLDILSVIAQPDEETLGDFWREQKHVKLPEQPVIDYKSLKQEDALKGKRIGVPKIYVGQQDSNPNAKPVTVNPEVVNLWEKAKSGLETLGAEVVYTDFPLVTNYEDDSVSGEANNIVGAPSNHHQLERKIFVAKAWDDFLKHNNDPNFPSLDKVRPELLFPKPENYIPDKWIESRNWIDYPGLPAVAAEHKDTVLQGIEGMGQLLRSLEAQRKRDLEDWMDDLKLDCVAFPANGDVGYADLEFDVQSAEDSLKNGVKYSNGNRTIRHLGIPTVSVPMGVMEGRKMPVNLTFAGKAYQDPQILKYAWAYEQKSKRRISPPLTPILETDTISRPYEQGCPVERPMVDLSVFVAEKTADDTVQIKVEGAVQGVQNATIEIYVDGEKLSTQNWTKHEHDSGQFQARLDYRQPTSQTLGWDLKPLSRPVMLIVVVKPISGPKTADFRWLHC